MYYIFVIKDIIVKIAKIDNQEMHGKMLNFAPFNNSVSALFLLGKYFRYFYHYSQLTKINSTKSGFFVVVGVALITVTKIILMNTFLYISKLTFLSE